MTMPSTQNIGIDKGRMLPEVHKLKQVTFQEIDDKELDLVSENIYLLQKLGMKNQLSELYKYAISVNSSKAIVREIGYLIMKEVVKDNNIDFFYCCPLAEEDQYSIWEQIIDDIFDEAVSDWKNGNKEDAMNNRKNMYSHLTHFLNYRIGSAYSPLYDEENDTEVPPSDEQIDAEMSKIIRLMGLFVSRRDEKMPNDPEGAWNRSERELIDEKEFLEYSYGDSEENSENILDELVQEVTDILDNGEKPYICAEGPLMADMMKKAKFY